MTENARDAYEIFGELVSAETEICSGMTLTPPLDPPLQEREQLDSTDEAIVERALAIRSNLELPFWDAVNLAQATSPSPSISLLRAAMRHNDSSPIAEEFSVDATLSSRLRLRAASLPPDRVLAVGSRVVLRDGRVKHIPMLDLSCRPGPASTKLVVGAARVLGISGFVMRSGKSFHLYGFGLQSGAERVAFLGKALLLAPIVDRAWIAHQLLEATSALRISSRPGYGEPPMVVATI